MEISLRFHDISKCSLDLSSDNDESIESVVIQTCSFLGDRFNLQIKGFGQGPWPVCPETDLADLITQAPNILQSLKKFSYFEIIFSEAHLSRRLEFHPCMEEVYQIQCFSWSTDVINFTEEIVSRHELLHIFNELLSTFAEGLKAISPESLNNHWIKKWIEQLGCADLFEVIGPYGN